MSGLIITVDIDWAPEPAIEETLDYLLDAGITPTVFSTHPSPTVEARLDQLEVGLHPFFDPTSSQGSTIPDTVAYVLDLPHNLPAYRCHRYGRSNTSQQAMAKAGMRLSSNTCTDLEIVPPFRDRFGLLEVPIFLEDGGYLWQQHSLEVSDQLLRPGLKVCTLHPMHFALNTPHFDRMVDIKRTLTRSQWQTLTRTHLDAWRWQGRGIRDLMVELMEASSPSTTLGAVLELHDLPALPLGLQSRIDPAPDKGRSLPQDTAADPR